MEYATKMQQYPQTAVHRTRRTAVSASIFGGAVYDSDAGIAEKPITPVIVPEGDPINRPMVVGVVGAPAPPISSDPRVAIDHAISIRAPRPEHATVFTGDRHFYGPYGSSIFGGGISGVGDAAMDAMAAGQAAGAAASAAAGAAARQRAMMAKRAAMQAARGRGGSPVTHRVGGRFVQATHGFGAVPPPHVGAQDVLAAAAMAAHAAAPMGLAASRAAAVEAAQLAANRYIAAGREANTARRAVHGLGALPTQGQASGMIFGASGAAAAGAAAGAAAACQRAGKTPAECSAAAQQAGNTEYTRQAGIQSAAIQAQVDAALKALAAVKANPDVAVTATDNSIPATAKAITETPSNKPIIIAALIGAVAIGGVIYLKTRKRGAAAAAAK